MKRALLFILLICGFPIFADTTLPAPWKHQDIGMAQTPGTAEHSDGVFTLSGTMDTWGIADGPHIVYQPAKGDVELIARVVSMDNPGKVAHAKASLTIRESLDAGVREVSISLTATDGTQFIYRDKPGEKSTHPKLPKDAPASLIPKGQFPAWLKITRIGNDFTGYESLDGKTWQKVDQIKLELPAETIIGMTVSSHKPDTLTTAKFDNVTIGEGKSAEKK